MADEILKIEPPEKTVKNALVYRGSITGNSSHPAAGYSVASIAPLIDFMIFSGISAYFWEFDRDNQVIQASLLNVSTELKEVAVGEDLSGETVNFEAFKYIG